ncbi:hypothetical protein L7F22_025252 [Adiantum nelumboides]|nr:hypothetical protein [Adiantum nelumboides]
MASKAWARTSGLGRVGRENGLGQAGSDEQHARVGRASKAWAGNGKLQGSSKSSKDGSKKHGEQHSRIGTEVCKLRTSRQGSCLSFSLCLPEEGNTVACAWEGQWRLSNT